MSNTLEEKIKKATEDWVRGWNSIPTQLLTPHVENSPFEVTKLTYLDSDGSDYSDELVAWNTMWTFEYDIDSEWARKNIKVMEDLGFVVYDSDIVGLFFGIDGGGYSFLEEHFIPLYKARGLQWHLNI